MLGLLQAQAGVVGVLLGHRLPGHRDDRGEIASSVWYMVGLVLLAVTVLAVVASKVQGKLNGI